MCSTRGPAHILQTVEIVVSESRIELYESKAVAKEERIDADCYDEVLTPSSVEAVGTADLDWLSGSFVAHAQLDTEEQEQMASKTEMRWCGSGSYQICFPLRTIVYLEDMKLCALIDTGSDYDAIDQDLFELLSERSPAFKSRTKVSAQSVKGFSAGMTHCISYISEWELTGGCTGL